MKAFITMLVATAALGLGACESDGSYSQSYGARAGWQTGWYDNYYGSIHDGYWGPSGLFFYRTAPDGFYHRDIYRHFRRNSFSGGVAFRFEDHGDRGRDGRWARR